MPTKDKVVRQSVSLPPGIAERVRAIAERHGTSTNRVLVDLIEAGLEFREAEKERFFALVDRLSETTNPRERRRINDELARLAFGDEMQDRLSNRRRVRPRSAALAAVRAERDRR